MRVKVERIAGKLGSLCSAWPGVEAVSLAESSEEDSLDPYFALSFDVFHRGALPSEERRRATFADAGAFESSRYKAKDRFLLEDMPIRIEYKDVDLLESAVFAGDDGFGRIIASGTYPLYRIQSGKILHDRSAWLAEARKRLSGLPAELWTLLAEAQAARMEHHLSDLGAAARMDDSFFYLEASAGFARQVASILFVLNRRFEPSHRSIDQKLRDLPLVPDDFFGRWEILLRSDIGMSREQKYEVAILIAKSVLSLR